jgi:hypothetical protein
MRHCERLHRIFKKQQDHPQPPQFGGCGGLAFSQFFPVSFGGLSEYCEAGMDVHIVCDTVCSG